MDMHNFVVKVRQLRAAMIIEQITHQKSAANMVHRVGREVDTLVKDYFREQRNQSL